MRIGNRANEGRAEMTVTLYLPDGRVLFTFGRPQIDHNDAFDAGRLRFEVLEPTQTLRTVYEGKRARAATTRSAMADPEQGLRREPRSDASPSTSSTTQWARCTAAPPSSRRESSAPADQQFAKAHYEQHMRVKR